MNNRISVEPQQDGTQVWLNTDEETGEVLAYNFVPTSTVVASDSIGDVQQFTPGHGKRTDPGGGVLGGPAAAALRALPVGTFVRLGVKPGRGKPPNAIGGK